MTTEDNDTEIKLIETSGFESTDFYHLFKNGQVKPKFEQWIKDAIQEFDTRIPVPPTFKPFNQDGYFRLHKHNRSFCYNPQPTEYQNVVCFKGCEVFAPDILQNIKGLSVGGPSHMGLTFLEHFITIEHKIPACVSYTEAIREANLAADIQTKYSQYYGEYAPLPFPLKVFRLSDNVRKDFEAKVDSLTSKVNRLDLSELLDSNGLAVYTYIYPTLPMRVSQLIDTLDNHHPKERYKQLITITPAPKYIIYSWIRLFARLCCLGYVPATTRSIFTGVLCDTKNAAIGGGFCDVGSIESIADIPSEKTLLDAMELSFAALCNTILSFLCGQNKWNSGFPAHQTRSWVYKRMCNEIKINSKKAPVHPIIHQYFNNHQTFDAMLDQLHTYY